MKPYKLGAMDGDDWVPFVYPNVWSMEETTGPDRMVIAPSSNQVELLRDLSRLLPEPFGVLYVLLVSRTGADAGRYQIQQPATRAQLDVFLTHFEEFLEKDGRHHLWVASLADSATLVYDNHNVIYAYGPLEVFRQVLMHQGLTTGEVRFPKPHSHNYNSEYDQSERDVLAYWDWIHFPLAEQDG